MHAAAQRAVWCGTCNGTVMLSLFLPCLAVATAAVELRDFPGCGQLGSTDKAECSWDCQYQVGVLQVNTSVVENC